MQIHKNASTAIHIASRRGAVKVRHIDARELARGEVIIKRAKGDMSITDGLTKCVEKVCLDLHLHEAVFLRGVP